MKYEAYPGQVSALLYDQRVTGVHLSDSITDNPRMGVCGDRGWIKITLSNGVTLFADKPSVYHGQATAARQWDGSPNTTRQLLPGPAGPQTAA